MHCPTLAELPSPPLGTSGWPWTEETQQVSDALAGDLPWPRISIVTPSLNQAKYIEETIRSVLLQGYPNLEYIIMDGGSMDGSLEIIKKYEPWLALWVSEKDEGQSHAINKGFLSSTGDILAWLNSDDKYAPDAFRKVGLYFSQNANCKCLYSNLKVIDAENQEIGIWYARPASLESIYLENGIPQPTVFLRREILDKIGLLQEGLHYAMDMEYWIRIAKEYSFCFLDEILAEFRRYPHSKGGRFQIKFLEDYLSIYRIHAGDIKKRKRGLANTAYMRAHLRLADEYRKLGNYPKMRKNFLQAVLRSPKVIFSKEHFRPFFQSFFQRSSSSSAE